MAPAWPAPCNCNARRHGPAEKVISTAIITRMAARRGVCWRWLRMILNSIFLYMAGNGSVSGSSRATLGGMAKSAREMRRRRLCLSRNVNKRNVIRRMAPRGAPAGRCLKVMPGAIISAPVEARPSYMLAEGVGGVADGSRRKILCWW